LRQRDCKLDPNLLKLRVQNIKRVIVSRIGDTGLEKVKILLASDTFHTLARKMNYLSFETYVSQMFDMIFTVSTIDFTSIWWEQQGEAVVKKTLATKDDILNTVAMAGIQMMKSRLFEVGKLSAMAQRLKSFSVMRRVHQGLTQRLEEFQRDFRPTLFEADVLPLLSPDEVREWSEIGEDVLLRMDFVANALAKLRVAGKISETRLPEPEVVVPLLTEKFVMRSLLKGNELPAHFDAELDEESQEDVLALGYVQVPTHSDHASADGYFRGGVINLFACIGSTFVDLSPIEKCNPVNKKPTEAVHLPLHEEVCGKYPTPGVNKPRHRLTQYIRANLNALKEIDLHGGNEASISLWNTISKNYQRALMTGVATEWISSDMLLKEIVERLRVKASGADDQVLEDLACARIIKLGGQLEDKSEKGKMYLRRKQ